MIACRHVLTEGIEQQLHYMAQGMQRLYDQEPLMRAIWVAGGEGALSMSFHGRKTFTHEDFLVLKARTVGSGDNNAASRAVRWLQDWVKGADDKALCGLLQQYKR